MSGSTADAGGDRPAGRLLLIPTPLDMLQAGGAATAPLGDVLPMQVLTTAARLRHWVCENAKVTRAFLKRVDAVVPLALPLQSLDIRELPRAPKGRPAPPPPWDALLDPARQGHDLGLASDAGMPAVADPGAPLVAAAHALGLVVESLVGPSALMLALAASGLNGQSFAFVGYVPQEAEDLARRLKDLETLARRTRQTQLLIETPYRNAALLRALLTHLSPATRLSVSCGLTLPGGWTTTWTVERWRTRRRDLPGDVPAVFAFLP